MRKLTWILWAIIILCYYLLQQPILQFLLQYGGYTFIMTVLGLIAVFFLLAAIIGNSKYASDIVYKTYPKAKLDFKIAYGFLSSIFLMFTVSISIPSAIIYLLEQGNVVVFGPELKIYSLFTICSMIITFYGKQLVSKLNKYNKNKTPESVIYSELVFSEDIIKTLLFGVYFIALIMTAVIKFRHIEVLNLSENIMNPVIMSFTTYIALDRIINNFRKFKTIKRE